MCGKQWLHSCLSHYFIATPSAVAKPSIQSIRPQDIPGPTCHSTLAGTHNTLFTIRAWSESYTTLNIYANNVNWHYYSLLMFSCVKISCVKTTVAHLGYMVKEATRCSMLSAVGLVVTTFRYWMDTQIWGGHNIWVDKDHNDFLLSCTSKGLSCEIWTF